VWPRHGHIRAFIELISLTPIIAEIVWGFNRQEMRYATSVATTSHRSFTAAAGALAMEAGKANVDELGSLIATRVVAHPSAAVLPLPLKSA
jgi:hypothetical protein